MPLRCPPAPLRIYGLLLVLVAGAATWARSRRPASAPTAAEREAPPAVWPPESLAATGLYRDGTCSALGRDVLPYSPQYPLWTDGAAKQRWIRLPAGAAIDATDPDAWTFPVGTRLWKEFRWERRVETRYLERRADGSWLFASYLWSADDREARLAPEGGVRGAYAIRPGLFHDVPGRQDCLTCHGGRATPVLGFSALQLSSDRDPLAPHAETAAYGSVDLPALLTRGLLVGAPDGWRTRPPRIPARSARERAALGYLHGNCSACHSSHAPSADGALVLEVPVGPAERGALAPALRTGLGVPSRFRPRRGEAEAALRLAPGRPEASVLWQRLASRVPSVQMPPLGTHAVDPEAVSLLEAWIREDLAAPAPLSLTKE